MKGPTRNSRGGLFSFLLCLTLVGQLACRKPTADDLAGVWHADYGKFKLILRLHGDKTFDEFFQREDETNIVSRTGKWEFTDFEGSSIVLKGALVVRDEVGTIESDDRNSGWILRVDKSLGHLRLIASEDQGLYLEKGRY
jgi:hypothetical protein